MSTNDAIGTRRLSRQAGLWRTRWPVMLVLLAAVVAGCSDSEYRPRSNGSTGPASQTHGSDSDKPMSQHRLDKLADFLDKVKFLDRVGPEFELRQVQYTSRTDAVAYFLDYRLESKDRGSVIATTSAMISPISSTMSRWAAERSPSRPRTSQLPSRIHHSCSLRTAR